MLRSFFELEQSSLTLFSSFCLPVHFKIFPTYFIPDLFVFTVVSLFHRSIVSQDESDPQACTMQIKWHRLISDYRWKEKETKATRGRGVLWDFDSHLARYETISDSIAGVSWAVPLGVGLRWITVEVITIYEYEMPFVPVNAPFFLPHSMFVHQHLSIILITSTPPAAAHFSLLRLKQLPLPCTHIPTSDEKSPSLF